MNVLKQTASRTAQQSGCGHGAFVTVTLRHLPTWTMHAPTQHPLAICAVAQPITGIAAPRPLQPITDTV